MIISWRNIGIAVFGHLCIFKVYQSDRFFQKYYRHLQSADSSLKSLRGCHLYYSCTISKVNWYLQQHLSFQQLWIRSYLESKKPPVNDPYLNIFIKLFLGLPTISYVHELRQSWFRSKLAFVRWGGISNLKREGEPLPPPLTSCPQAKTV